MGLHRILRIYFSQASLAFALGVAPACQKTTSLTAHSPQDSAVPRPLPPRQASTLNVPLQIPTAVLEQELNKQIAQVLYQDDDLQLDNLAVTVTKAGPLRIKAEFSKLYLEIPLKVWAKGRWQWNACEWCKNIQKTEETEFDLVVRTESRIQVMPDYTLKSYTAGDFAWGDRKPTLALGPLNINLVPFLEPKLRAQLNPLLLQMDQELQKRVDLKGYVAQAWEQLQQPFPLSAAAGGAWLSVQPQAIRVTPLELKQNQIRLNLGIEAFLGVVTGRKPTLATNQPLPNLTPVRDLAPTAQLDVALDTPFGELEKLAQQELRQKTFQFQEGKHQITVHDVTLAGHGTKLLLQMNVSGVASSGFIKKKFEGNVFLTGLPYFDASSQTLRVKELDFSVATRDQLVNTADWLLHNTFRTQLEKQMVLPLKEQLDQLRQALQAGLAQNQWHERVVLKGTVASFAPDTLFVTATGVRTIFTGAGALAVHVQ